jgi:hypothetical protein
MGKKSVKSRKEKMPANSEEYFSAVSQRIDCSAGCAFWWQCPSNAGDYKEHYRIKKGGSDPLSLFGPQAGRKEGVAPALLPYSPACLFRAPKLVKFCSVKG